jgi:hypothetical protein
MGGGRLSFDDCERLAAEVRARARLSPSEVESSPRTAMKVLGADSVRVIRRLSTSGALVRMHGDYLVFVRESDPDPNFTVAHELGHWALRTIASYSGPNEERYADRIGAAIIAPPRAVERAFRWCGDDERTIARAFFSTESMASLRVAEVLGLERALYAPRSAHQERVVTLGRFSWGPPGTVMAWAKGRAPAGVHKSRLRSPYDRGRIVLRAG